MVRESRGDDLVQLLDYRLSLQHQLAEARVLINLNGGLTSESAFASVTSRSSMDTMFSFFMALPKKSCPGALPQKYFSLSAKRIE